MVSGLVTSPELQERICLEDARPISMASKLLMSIKVIPRLVFRLLPERPRPRPRALLRRSSDRLLRRGPPPRAPRRARGPDPPPRPPPRRPQPSRLRARSSRRPRRHPWHARLRDRYLAPRPP